MQTLFTLAQLADPAGGGIRAHPAHLRALRLLHRDLPDLCARWRRARQPARPHLPDQGHAGIRPAGEPRGGQAHRSLPVVPSLHDHLPVRGCTTCTWSIMPAPASRPPMCVRCATAGCAPPSPGSCPTTDCCAGPCGWRGWRGRSPGSSRPAASSRLPPCCGSPRLGCRHVPAPPGGGWWRRKAPAAGGSPS